MKFTSSIAHRYISCAFAFPLCMTLHASTIATVSARAFYSTPAISWNIPCSQTSQTDPASASCVLNSSAYPQADYNASATVADGDVTVNVLGGTSVRAAAEANVLASFIDSFTFIPDNGQNAPTQVQYALLYGGNSTSDVPMGILETFNGAQILQGGGGESFVDHGLTSITQPYSGGTFESAGQITADFEFDSGDAGFAFAELQVRSITMLDAQGQAVAGTLVPTPEPALWPLTGLLGVGLALFAKRRAGRLL